MRSIPLLLFALTILAQTPKPATIQPDAHPTDPKDLCRVEGIVLNGVTGEKIRKATVQLKSKKFNYEVTTDATGLFSFDKVEPGTEYRIEGDHPGFVHHYYGSKRAGGVPIPFDLTKGQQMSAVEVKMVPNGSVTGKLTDEDGDPVVNAAVQLMKYTMMNGKMQMNAWGYANSDDEGAFKFSSVAPGKYYIRASPPQKYNVDTTVKANPTKPEQGYTPTYYPGSIERSGAAAVQVIAGQPTAGTNIQLRKTEVHRITGKIVTDAIGGQQNVMVQAYRVESAPMRGAMGKYGYRKPDGSFEITSLRSGQYMLALSAFGGQQRTLARQLVTVGAEDLENIVLTAGTGVSIKGSVRVIGTKPGTDPPSLSGVRIMANSIEDPYAAGNVTPKDDGSFHLADLSPNKYSVMVINLPDDSYVKSVMSGNSNLIENALDLDSAAGEVPMEITISVSAAQIEGSVQDEKGQPAAARTLVLLMPDTANPDITNSRGNGASTDKNGKFSIKKVAPGNYKLLAFEDFSNETDLDPDVLKKLDSKVTKITVEENGKGTAQLKWVTVAELALARNQ